MPTKILIINPFIIFLYVILFKYFDNNKIALIIIFNFLQWVFVYNIADIKYKSQEICYAKEAIDYKFQLSLGKGKLIDFITSNDDMSVCYAKYMGKYSEVFINGKPLKLGR